MISVVHSSAKRRFIGVFAAILLLLLIVVARNVTASEQEETSPTPTPERTTVPIGSAPLTLTKTASTDAVLPGQSFTYTLRITTSREQARVEVRDMLDRGVEVVGIESASGVCTSTGMIVCTVQVQAQKPATILITVRARTTSTPDSWLVSQAIAQDDSDFTAASERVAVRVAAPPPSMSAPVATAPPSPGTPSSDAALPPDRPSAPESRAVSRTGALLSPAPTTTTLPLAPAAAPPRSRTASALVGATNPVSAAPPDTPDRHAASLHTAEMNTVPGTRASIPHAGETPAYPAPVFAPDPPAPAATSNGSEQPASWLDLVVTVNP